MNSMLDILKENAQDIKSVLDGVDRGTTNLRFVSGSVESIGAVGSYVPIVDIYGKGRFYGAIFCAVSNNNYIGLRITVDGNVIYHVQCKNSFSSFAGVFNPSIVQPYSTNGYNILGVHITHIDSLFVNYLVPLSSSLKQATFSSNYSEGLPCIIPDFIRFEKSLKVEVMTNYNSTDKKTYSVLYDLDN